jgi:hypothetical protein
MTFIQIYIPRILGSVKRAQIKESFINMEIGKIIDIDMKFKINENKNAYYYAFITIELFDTIRANNFQNSVYDFGMIRLLYDEKNAQYWEIKHHVKKNERKQIKTNKIVPYYRFNTLLNSYNMSTEENKTETYKPYNMWNNSFNLLENKPIELFC